MSAELNSYEAKAVHGTNGTSNGTNGTNGTNGSKETSGHFEERMNSESSVGVGKSSTNTAGPMKKEKAPPLPKPTRAGVDSSFAQFAQLIHASRRPLPIQNGDGTYSEGKKRPGFKKDLQALTRRGRSTMIPL